MPVSYFKYEIITAEVDSALMLRTDDEYVFKLLVQTLERGR